MSGNWSSSDIDSAASKEWLKNDCATNPALSSFEFSANFEEVFGAGDDEVDTYKPNTGRRLKRETAVADLSSGSSGFKQAAFEPFELDSSEEDDSLDCSLTTPLHSSNDFSYPGNDDSKELNSRCNARGRLGRRQGSNLFSQNFIQDDTRISPSQPQNSHSKSKTKPMNSSRQEVPSKVGKGESSKPMSSDSKKDRRSSRRKELESVKGSSDALHSPKKSRERSRSRRRQSARKEIPEQLRRSKSRARSASRTRRRGKSHNARGRTKKSTTPSTSITPSRSSSQSARSRRSSHQFRSIVEDSSILKSPPITLKSPELNRRLSASSRLLSRQLSKSNGKILGNEPISTPHSQRSSVRSSRKSLMKDELFFGSPTPQVPRRQSLSTRRLQSPNQVMLSPSSFGKFTNGSSRREEYPSIEQNSRTALDVNDHKQLTPRTHAHSDSSANPRNESFNPRLDGLLQKLRDPSDRNLGAGIESLDDDDDKTAQGVPHYQRRNLARLAPHRHQSLKECI